VLEIVLPVTTCEGVERAFELPSRGRRATDDPADACERFVGSIAEAAEGVRIASESTRNFIDGCSP
jgi:hypothetical protein